MPWKSTDGGATWAPAAGGLPTRWAVQSLAPHPTNPAVLLAAVSGIFGSGIYRSTNGGQTWTLTNLTDSMWRVLFDPDQPSHAYAISYSNLYRSLDGGVTWQLASSQSTYIDHLVKSGPALLAAFLGDLHRSLDGGLTWAPYGAGLPGTVDDLVTDPQLSTTVYAIAYGEVYRSLDAGATWTRLAPQIGDASGLAIDPSRAETIYLARRGGPSALRSLTKLATTVPFDLGLPSGLGGRLAVGSGGGAILLGTPTRGLFRLGN
jgi:photosystem II stability/assembly factor-like uncharacterized protein